MDTKTLGFDEVEVPEDRLRGLDQEKLDRIRVSMTENGQMTPIEVVGQQGRKRPYRLVFGYHRYEAAKLARLDGIKAQFYEGRSDENSLRLREIDENLARADLSQYDRANFIAERARLWKDKYGTDAIKPGPKKKGQGAPNSFIEDVCEKFGLSKDEVKRHRTRFENTDPTLWAALKGTPAADNGVQLTAIKSLSKEKQLDLLKLLQPSLTLPKKEFNAAFNAALASVRGLKVPKQLTDDDKAEALVRLYRDAAPKIQALFRKKLELVPATSKRANSAGAEQ
jgi:ParB family chromosome partitioning protein